MRGLDRAARPAVWRARGLVALLVLLLVACRGSAPLAGSDLGGVAAPDFALVDGAGQTVQLLALRGRPVVLTFLYTRCPDECPLTASKLRRVVDDLGGAAERVAFLAVTTDPEHDDAAAVAAFSEAHRLAGRWHFLLGDRAALEPVWSAYHMYVAPPADEPLQRAAAQTRRGGDHTDALYVIDRQGRQRTFLRSDFDPPALAATLRTLLAE